jgi:dipeptidyl aminopeptidase/acylaminoacyl peptidase
MTCHALLCCAVAATLGAQADANAFARDLPEAEARVAKWRDLVVPFARRIEWVDGGKAVAFSIGDGDARRYVRVDCATGERSEAADAKVLGLPLRSDELEPQPMRVSSKNGGPSTSLRMRNEWSAPVVVKWIDASGVEHAYGSLEVGEERSQHTYAGHAWRFVAADGAVVGAFVAQDGGGVARIGDASRDAANARRRSRDRDAASARSGDAPRVRAFVRDHNVHVAIDGGDVALTTDGAAADCYRGDLHVSPDGGHLLAFQVVPEQEHTVTLIESSPKDQVQPKLHTLQYLKPGDRIARPRPRLFDLKQKTRIDVDEAPFVDAWSIDRVHWAKDGSEVRVLYNRRGHQQLAVRAIDAKTGAVRTIVDETSKTFVDYSQKTNLIWLQQRDELLWTSERDGNCHLYRIDAATGAAVQLTRGDYRVRKIEHVDENAREVWVTALGFHQGQDPYHRHLVRVPLDGGESIAVTSSDGDCEWELSEDRSHAIVRWSRIDQPTVTELRRCKDGALLAELGRDDASKLLAAGFAFAERFVAKGRDGATDIHGIALMPKLQRDGERLPVIEAIYAGPHDFHVPKSFELQLRLRALCELGFCVVQIDGMGTNWRSKAFHDVCWQNLKDAGFPDRIAWIRAFAAKHADVDATRVGVFGGSAGGQNALAALLWHGDFYKAAAADCGCHDNRMDKIWWNEAWMGWPIDAHYAANSNVEHASRLQGKLLLTVGEMDRNVDPASTLQVVDALLKAGKDFDFVLVPGGGHGCGEMPTLAARRAAFFVRHLRGGA